MKQRIRQRAYERGDLIYHSSSRTFGVVISEDETYQHAFVKFFSGETITICYESVEKYWSSKWLPQALSSTFINVTLEDENHGIKKAAATLEGHDEPT